MQTTHPGTEGGQVSELWHRAPRDPADQAGLLVLQPGGGGDDHGDKDNGGGDWCKTAVIYTC